MPDVWVHTSVVGDFRPDVGRQVCVKHALLWYTVRILRTSDFLLGEGGCNFCVIQQHAIEITIGRELITLSRMLLGHRCECTDITFVNGMRMPLLSNP